MRRHKPLFPLLMAAFGLALAPVARAQPVRPLVEVRTTFGRMVVALFNETPTHRDNFLRQVRAQAYDSTIIHRVVPGLLVEGGHPMGRNAHPDSILHPVRLLTGLPGEVNAGLHHFKGALAAVPLNDSVLVNGPTDPTRYFFVLGNSWEPEALSRIAERNDNPGLLSAAEGYAKRGGAPHLDGTCTVFGEVVEGVDVLDLIAAEPCDQQDRPLTDVRLWMSELP